MPQGHIASGGNGDSQTRLLLRTMLGSMVLWRLGSELKSMSRIDISGHIEAQVGAAT